MAAHMHSVPSCEGNVVTRTRDSMTRDADLNSVYNDADAKVIECVRREVARHEQNKRERRAKIGIAVIMLCLLMQLINAIYYCM